MPTYEYECASCGKNFEVFQSMSEAPVRACPSCGQSVKRLIHGGTGVIFKGSGFYKNDSRKSGPAKGASSDTAAPKPCESCAAAPACEAAASPSPSE